jgi:hypothetical protein
MSMQICTHGAQSGWLFSVSWHCSYDVVFAGGLGTNCLKLAAQVGPHLLAGRTGLAQQPGCGSGKGRSDRSGMVPNREILVRV